MLDPDGLPLVAAARGRRHARRSSRSACPAAARCTRTSGGADVGRVPLLLLDSDVEEQRPRRARRHRPPLRRRRRAPAAAGAAARHRRRPRAARVLPHHRRTPSPRCSTPTRATPASSASSASASSCSRRASPSTRRWRPCAPAPSSPRTPRCPPASTASRATLIEQYFGGDNAGPGVPGRAHPRARCRGLRGRRPDRVQHGRHGPAPRPARQRRLACCTARSAAGCSPACGRASTPTRCRSARSPTACTPRPGWRARSATCSPRQVGPSTPRRPRGWEAAGQIPAADLWAHQARAARSGSSPTSARGCATSWEQRGASDAELGWIDDVLDPDVLTIGFARRVPSYKRLTLMLRDPERLQARCCSHPDAPGADRHRRQVAPGRRRRQEADPAARAVRRRPRGAPPHRVPARLRHRHGAAALPGLRRVAEQPAAPARGVRHVGHEGRAQRRPQPVDPRRLVGRVVRRRERLGDPHRRRRRRPRPA